MSLRRWRIYRAALAAGVLLGVLALVFPAFPKKVEDRRTKGVIALPAHQPSARRVYQPAALP
jgi:hypothetical protein